VPVSACLIIHVEIGGRTIILQVNQGCHEPVAEHFKGRICPRGPKRGPEEDAEFGYDRPQCEEELEDLVTPHWTFVAERFKGRISPLGPKIKGFGPEEDEAIEDERPQYEEELEGVFDGFGTHGESEEGGKEALR
jgi:hypothetical protein